jgi:hypothetical protein
LDRNSRFIWVVSENVSFQATGVKSGEAPEEVARETRMVKPKGYECLLMTT